MSRLNPHKATAHAAGLAARFAVEAGKAEAVEAVEPAELSQRNGGPAASFVVEAGKVV